MRGRGGFDPFRGRGFRGFPAMRARGRARGNFRGRGWGFGGRDVFVWWTACSVNRWPSRFALWLLLFSSRYVCCMELQLVKIPPYSVSLLHFLPRICVHLTDMPFPDPQQMGVMPGAPPGMMMGRGGARGMWRGGPWGPAMGWGRGGFNNAEEGGIGIYVEDDSDGDKKRSDSSRCVTVPLWPLCRLKLGRTTCGRAHAI